LSVCSAYPAGSEIRVVSDSFAPLVTRCQRGDTAAFSELVAATQGGVYNLAFSVLHDHEEAQDITQEIYLRIWRALPGFRGDAKFTTWLYRVAMNACLNRRRQLRPQLAVVDSEDALERVVVSDGDPAAAAITNERNKFLWAAVARLPAKYRVVIALFYQQQMSYQEIAEILSLPLGTIKAHLNRAREVLARSLGAEVEDERVPLSTVS
jgi:RNA polymerase sigma-70 factor (ECF subfamily)